MRLDEYNSCFTVVVLKSSRLSDLLNALGCKIVVRISTMDSALIAGEAKLLVCVCSNGSLTERPISS